MSTADADRPLLSNAPLGEVTHTGDTLTVAFRRRYRAPIEKVWAALTIPERLADWFVGGEIDLRAGGQMSLERDEIPPMTMQIAICDPPNLLVWAWTIAGRETLVRFDLETTPDGCQLTLTHSGVPRSAAGVRAGWHAHLEGLVDALDGRSTPWSVKTARETALSASYPKLPD